MSERNILDLNSKNAKEKGKKNAEFQGLEFRRTIELVPLLYREAPEMRSTGSTETKFLFS